MGKFKKKSVLINGFATLILIIGFAISIYLAIEYSTQTSQIVQDKEGMLTYNNIVYKTEYNWFLFAITNAISIILSMAYYSAGFIINNQEKNNNLLSDIKMSLSNDEIEIEKREYDPEQKDQKPKINKERRSMYR